MNRASSAPIGLFDSGVGGLTVLQEIAKLLPYENIAYLGDTARLPYGSKTPETLLHCSIENAKFLLEKEIKFLVIACNTASVYALEPLQKMLPVPVLGVIQPGIEELLETTQTKRVGIIGTQSTIASGIFQSSLQNRAEVFTAACPLLVSLAEEGLFSHKAAGDLIEYYLAPFRTANIDTLLLACTHFPPFKPLMQKFLGPSIQIVDPARKLAEQVKETLDPVNLEMSPPKYEFYATDNVERFQQKAELFLNSPLFYPKLTNGMTTFTLQI